MWGTVWDETSGAKYSISHPKLFAERAVLVPELTLSVPLDLTLFTALDALSHCMESTWNKRSSAVSRAFSVGGITRIPGALDEVLANPTDIDARRSLQESALLGGFAISCTATALAHSISYPLTSKLGMPHGLACSFTLPELMRFNAEADTEAVEEIATALCEDSASAGATKLAEHFARWNVPGHVNTFLNADKARAMKDQLLTPGRADNNVRAASHDDALGIVLRSLQAS